MRRHLSVLTPAMVATHRFVVQWQRGCVCARVSVERREMWIQNASAVRAFSRRVWFRASARADVTGSTRNGLFVIVRVLYVLCLCGV